MATQTGLTLNEIDQQMKDLLLITDNAAAHWDATVRLRYINQAQLWVQYRTLPLLHERRTVLFNFTMDGSTYEVLLPQDLIVEVALFKQDLKKTGEQAFDQIRMIRPKQESSWQTPGQDETFVANGKSLRAKGPSPPSGAYRLEYVQRAPDLVASTDKCQLDADLHEIVATRAAERCAMATSDSVLQDRLQAELKDWLAEVKERSVLFDELRSGATTPRQGKDFHDSSLFRLMERTRARLAGILQGDLLSPDRLRIALNEGQERVALRVKQVFESQLETYFYFTMTGDTFDVFLPKSFKSAVILERRSSADSGELGWFQVPIIRPTDRDFHVYSSTRAAIVPTGTAAMAFLIVDNKLRAVASEEPIGDFRLLYIPRVTPMMSDQDECGLSGEYHQAVILEACKDLCAAYGRQDSLAFFMAELKVWDDMIVRDACRRNYSDNDAIRDVMGWASDGDGLAYPYGW
jgi:hypothetical protein